MKTFLFTLLLLFTGKTNKNNTIPINNKIFPDRGDKWKDTYKDLNTLDYRVRYFFISLILVVEKYNKLYNKNFVVFEARRNIKRQERLIKKGVSWIVNALTAPHVQGRAVDIVELINGVYIWDSKELKKLRDYIEEHFKYNEYLRKRIEKDLPHYEFSRKVFNKLVNENMIFEKVA